MRAALLALVLSTTALGAVGTVTVVDGPAFRTPKGGAEQPLQQGASVELDDTLRTGPAGGLKVTLTDQSVVVLGPDSELLVERAEFEGQERSRVSLKLLVGGIWAKVKKAIAGTDSTFEVSAARAVAGVRGTIFRVDATPLIAGTHPPKIRETVVRVSEGRVAVNAQVKKSGAKPPPQGTPGRGAGAHRGDGGAVGEALRRAPGRPRGAHHRHPVPEREGAPDEGRDRPLPPEAPLSGPAVTAPTKDRASLTVCDGVTEDGEEVRPAGEGVDAVVGAEPADEPVSTSRPPGSSGIRAWVPAVTTYTPARRRRR